MLGELGRTRTDERQCDRLAERGDRRYLYAGTVALLAAALELPAAEIGAFGSRRR